MLGRADAAADPDVEAPLEQVVEGADLLGELERVVERKEVDERAETDPCRRLRRRREQEPDLRHRVERDHVVLGLEVVGEARVVEVADQLESIPVELPERLTGDLDLVEDAVAHDIVPRVDALSKVSGEGARFTTSTWDAVPAMRRMLPSSAPGDVSRIVWGRTLRGFVDGFVSVLLAQYLTGLGFSPVKVGAIVTGTLVGSAAMTLAFGLTAHRTSLRTLLLIATAMMVATGAGFAAITQFWPLFVVAVLGTMNPSAGDVSVFLPTEQAYVAGMVDAPERPHLFATYNLAAIFAGAVGALLSGLPEVLAHRNGWDVLTAQRAGFVLYAVAAVVIFLIYRRLHDEIPTARRPDR